MMKHIKLLLLFIYLFFGEGRVKYGRNKVGGELVGCQTSCAIYVIYSICFLLLKLGSPCAFFINLLCCEGSHCKFTISLFAQPLTFKLTLQRLTDEP